MDHDDDVEHLFSWLQTPELRYREFAGAREITDAVITSQARPDSTEAGLVPSHNTQLEEEYPLDQFPDQEVAPADIMVQQRPAAAPRPPVAPPTVTTTPTGAAAPGPAAYAAGLFALGAGGRNTPPRPHYEEPVVPPPIIQTPAPRQAAAPVAPRPAPAPLPAPPVPSAAPAVAATPIAAPAAPRPAAPSNGGGLLGGAYRQDGLEGHGVDSGAAAQPAADGQQRSEASLDAVFGRLSGARQPLPDPRDRMRHIPGFNPPPNRSR